MAEMRKLTAYFSLLSGNSRWDENAERIFDDLFHKDVTIVGVQKSFDFDGWKSWYEHSIRQGLVFEMEKLVKLHKEDAIVYTLKIRNSDGTELNHTAKGIFKEGKLIRTEPVDPRVYDSMSKGHIYKRQTVALL